MFAGTIISMLFSFLSCYHGEVFRVWLNYLYNSNQSNIMEKLESIVKVSGKGQVVIPKEVREKLGIKTGGKLVVIVRDDDIILRKIEKISVSEMSSRISSVVEKENIDVDKLIMEAVEWARKQK